MEIRNAIAIALAVAGCGQAAAPGAAEEALGATPSCQCRHAIYADGSAFCEIVACQPICAAPTPMPPPGQPTLAPPPASPCTFVEGAPAYPATGLTACNAWCDAHLEHAIQNGLCAPPETCANAFNEALASAGEAGTQPAASYMPGYFGD